MKPGLRFQASGMKKKESLHKIKYLASLLLVHRTVHHNQKRSGKSY